MKQQKKQKILEPETNGTKSTGKRMNVKLFFSFFRLLNSLPVVCACVAALRADENVNGRDQAQFLINWPPSPRARSSAGTTQCRHSCRHRCWLLLFCCCPRLLFVFVLLHFSPPVFLGWDFFAVFFGGKFVIDSGAPRSCMAEWRDRLELGRGMRTRMPL